MYARPAIQTGTESDVGAAEDHLADVVDLPIDVPSFYQKNSGSLPKAHQGVSDAHRRANLPSATNEEDSLFVRVRRIIGL